ncbi:patatin-like phospholipase family protein [Fulvivirgaceae bacterium BMA10]|uniref:Patatin-like phospholipase family protein n=1 Tax=Splendidivirga corallicola TaxID=3051826 RepID=A0ABT8KJI5_9BACT|nr:patatin-like phospholipase family protein [Fulvivirgaceae bacterium BMA10]
MFEKLFYSFPVQLLINHIKKNHALLLCWIILFAVVTGNFGRILGIPYLFLDPEYMNKTGFWSFFIVGITVGGFVMAFHITSYIIDGDKFRFLGALTRPFTKFCINNSIIPLAFMITYIISIVRFQIDNEYGSTVKIFVELSGFITGFSCMIIFLFTYFWTTNKDIFKILASNVEKKLKRVKATRIQLMKKYQTERKNVIRVDNYINLSLRFKFRIRNVSKKVHQFDKEAVLKVFDQNHLNSVVIEVFIIFVILGIGLFREYAFFQIPAAASVILLLTILIMIAGALTFWVRGWTLTTILAVLILFNFIIKGELLKRPNEAFGLDYSAEKVDYSMKSLVNHNSSTNYNNDKRATLEILENWRKKFSTENKPKMIFICSSGGGLRSALWTLNVLQNADSVTNGALMKHAMLMTGASGGLIGESYFRELILKKQKGDPTNPYNKKYLEKIATDKLNPIIFTLLVNDLFVPLPQYFKYNGQRYLKDRGYAFEQQLNKNTDFVLDKPLSAYKAPEQASAIPMVLLSPTIINDGRKLFISPQNVSYMNMSDAQINHSFSTKIKGIDFMRFFDEQGAADLRFSSALRMSATFPYVTPNIALPSKPTMELMDAGISDNFGISDATRFLYVFKDWISKNTSGVIFMLIRDSEKNRPIEKNLGTSLVQKFFNPIKSIYTNWDNIQDIKNDNLIEYIDSWYNGKVEKVVFEYIPRSVVTAQANTKNYQVHIKEERANERAALSWHLTTREKESIINSIQLDYNKKALSRLKQLINNNMIVAKATNNHTNKR